MDELKYKAVPQDRKAFLAQARARKGCAETYIFFFQAEDGIRDYKVTGVQTCALPIYAAQQRAAIVKPYDVAAMMLMLTALLVGIFYCLDALHGERRDRSILFWKSLPVSDRKSVV